MPTKEQIDLLIGPLGLTFGLIIAVVAFARGWVVSKSAADAREAAAVKRGDEWKAQAEKQVEVNAAMAAALDRNTDTLTRAGEIMDAAVERARR